MKIGILKEIKEDENRVAITPGGVKAFVSRGHKVLIEKGAGLGSGFSDKHYLEAGAEVVELPYVIWKESDMILKVKEPLENELELMQENQILFTYLHLSANEKVLWKLLEKKVISIGYESIQLKDGSLPLLIPMSEIAGRLSIQCGSRYLEITNGGKGVLLSGVTGVPPAEVVIIGAGVSGINAAQVAAGMGAQVSVVDVNVDRLRYVESIFHKRVITIVSNSENIKKAAKYADILIGAVLIPCARTPKLITYEILKSMKEGAVIVDISVDQGGCAETTHPTTHSNPVYTVEGVIHYCVTNMPSSVPRTSTIALTNVTLPYALEIADKGFNKAIKDNLPLFTGVNTFDGRVVHPVIAETFSLPCYSLLKPPWYKSIRF